MVGQKLANRGQKIFEWYEHFLGEGAILPQKLI